jgi:trimeric autotransporter adhesin
VQVINVTTGVENTLIGGLAGDALTDADYNVAIGYTALTTDTLGSRSVAIGRAALQAQNFTSATNAYNVAVGFAAGETITTGVENTLIGGRAGDSLTIGEKNIAIGQDALGEDDVGSRCVAIGHNALGSQNSSGATVNNMRNVAVGFAAQSSVSTGYYNVSLGYQAGDDITDGQRNICIGHDADISAGSTNDFSFGKPGNVVSNDFDTDANWSRSSDERLKKNITNQTLGLDFINDLRTVKYKWKANGELDASDSQLAHLRETDDDGNIINYMNTDATMHNFIAQEVKAALDTAGVSDFAGWKEDHYGVQQVSREMFVIPLVKAIQEQNALIEALTARIATLEG